MRTPIAIYPYCAELLPVVRHFEQCQEDYTFIRLLSPSGLGIAGRDAGYVCNHPSTGIVVSNDAEITEVSWEVLFLYRPEQPNVVDAGQLTAMARRTLEAGGKVVYFDNSIRDIPVEINELSLKQPDRMTIHTEDSKSYPGMDTDNGRKLFHSPVVLVGGLVTGEDSFHVLTALAVYLHRHGMSPAVFSRHAAGGMMGFHTLAHHLENRAMSVVEKIETIHRYVAGIEHHEMPNIILMEAPDAVLRYNNAVHNGFGIQTYLLCQAVEPDMFVLCLPCDMAEENLVEALSQDFAIRLGSAITAVHVSNVVIDSADVLQTRKISSVHMCMEMVKEQLAREKNGLSVPMFDIISDGADELGKLILDLCTEENGGGSDE